METETHRRGLEGTSPAPYRVLDLLFLPQKTCWTPQLKATNSARGGICSPSSHLCSRSPQLPAYNEGGPTKHGRPQTTGKTRRFPSRKDGPARHRLHSRVPLHEADVSPSMRKTEGGPTGETRKQKGHPQQARPRENGRAERPLLPGAGSRGNPVLLPWQQRGKETLASPGPPSNTKHTDVVIQTLLQDDSPEVVGTTPRVSAREHWLLGSTELSGQVGDLEPSHLTLVSSATAKRGHTKALLGYGEGWHDHLAQSVPLVHWHHSPVPGAPPLRPGARLGGQPAPPASGVISDLPPR